MPDRSNVAYTYDGSFAGLLCCVFESFEKRELPAAVTDENECGQLVLYSRKPVESDGQRAARVENWLKRISSSEFEFFRDGFLTCLEGRELHLIRLAWLYRRRGAKALELVSQEDVFKLTKAVRHMHNEAHLLLGFVRFSEYRDFLFAVITPKNNLLPLITPHFCSRFNAENFVIADKTHGVAAVYEKKGSLHFADIGEIEMPTPGAKEEKYRELWRRFYNSIAVEGRINEKLRQNHMPKRYWENMTEMRK